jgi:acid phosphatase (class A)
MTAVSFNIRRLIVAAALGLLAGGAALAAPAPAGYLAGAPLGYAVPAPPPDGGETERMDLAMVRSVQATPASIAWQEANGDARAYNAKDVIRRFEDATAETLTVTERPILVGLLNKVILDTSDYAAQAKKSNPRNRPYVGHADIAACNMNYIKDSESYPSGHAMNGYVVAAVLAEIFPEREHAILSRGIRYGDNRVVCGVHHPIDVQEGRLLGIAYLAVLRPLKPFQDDLACAKQEAAVIDKALPALSPRCAAAEQDFRRQLQLESAPKTLF